MLTSTLDASVIGLAERFLLQPCLAAVCHSLVERLEVFERRLRFVRRRRAEVFVKPLVRRAPALRILLADLLREILA